MADCLDLIMSLLTTNWSSANTDNITPTIDLIFNIKEFGGLGQSKSYCLIGPNGNNIIKPAGMGTNIDSIITLAYIDIRTEVSRAHLIKCIAEVKRILKANYSRPDTANDYIKLIREIDLSDKRKNLWRFKIDWEIYDYIKSY